MEAIAEMMKPIGVKCQQRLFCQRPAVAYYGLYGEGPGGIPMCQKHFDWWRRRDEKLARKSG
jgi:hypothetical protein